MPNRQRKQSTSRDVSTRKQVAAPPTSRVGRHSIGAPKLNSMQLAELLRPFWMELLQNNLKNVKKFLRENHSKIDFNTARYTACADGTGLHLCAQHGFIACAKLLLEFGVKIDLQNKVGSTALHVACKFNQEEMVLFLLELGARMDIPDLRNNVAFDVSPYTLLDNCLLSPQRAKLAAEQQEEDRLLEIHQASVTKFEEVTLAKGHASMLLIDWESRAWEEWQALQATNKVDREWSEQVQRSRDRLEIKRAMYTDLQVQLQMEQNQIAQMWKTMFRDARDRQERAREELEQMRMLTEETHQHWMQEQQQLWDQCGLIETAQEFPNDTDVQQWVLCTMIAMIDEAYSRKAPINLHLGCITTDINELLVREEIISTIRNVLVRFPTTRDLQLSALQCFARLVRHCITPPIDIRACSFLTALISANIMALGRDVLSHFKQDVELAHLVIELIYHLLQFRGENGAHSLQFCQNRFSHQLPLQVFRLHETIFPLQDDAESFHVNSIVVSPKARLAARHHASFLLFTLIKYNVKKTLDKDGVIPAARRLIFELTKSTPDDNSISDETRTSTLRYLLGSLALMYSSPSQNGSNNTSPQANLTASWSVNDLRQLLEAIRPWLVVDNSENGSLTNGRCSLVFWTMKLLRNLTQSAQDEVVQHRTWMRTRETFDLLAEITLPIRKHKSKEGGDTAVKNIVVTWLELVEDIWLCRYNSDGQLAATSSFVLEFLVQLLEIEAELVGLPECPNAFVNIAAVLKLIALVLPNGKNMLYLVDRAYKIDVALHTILKKHLDTKQESQGNDPVDETCTFELLAHILRIYLRFFDYERDHTKSGTNLHERCRAIGICATLHAFGFSDSENREASFEAARCTSPNSNANQSEEKPVEIASNSKLKSKMQLAQAWSRSTVQQQQSSRGPERETLCALVRALHRHAPCHC